MPRHSSDGSASPVRGRESPHKRSQSRKERSPGRRRSSRRSKSPAKNSSSHRTRSPDREKRSSRARSPRHAESNSPLPRSPSPRTKRLKRAQAEREVEKVTEKEYEKNGSKDRERARHSEKSSEREVPREKAERRSEKDNAGGEFSRSRRERERSVSPTIHHHRGRHGSHSPPRDAKNGYDEGTNSRGAKQQRDDDSIAKMNAAEEAIEEKQKQKPSFELSGKLASETNRVRGITLLFTEPPEARKPDIRWRLYVFKAGEVLNEPLYIHRQSCYLFGRERRVADVPTDHPSCSKQHAVVQFRQIEKEQPDGMLSKQVRPYLMDLGSTNGTFINDSRIEPQRYYELFEKDTIKFGNSSREYVILHENSTD